MRRALGGGGGDIRPLIRPPAQRCTSLDRRSDHAAARWPCRFHQVEPQADLPPLPQDELSKLVVTRAKRTVPYPILGENTLVRRAHARISAIPTLATVEDPGTVLRAFQPSLATVEDPGTLDSGFRARGVRRRC